MSLAHVVMLWILKTLVNVMHQVCVGFRYTLSA